MDKVDSAGRGPDRWLATGVAPVRCTRNRGRRGRVSVCTLTPAGRARPTPNISTASKSPATASSPSTGYWGSQPRGSGVATCVGRVALPRGGVQRGTEEHHLHERLSGQRHRSVRRVFGDGVHVAQRREPGCVGAVELEDNPVMIGVRCGAHVAQQPGRVVVGAGWAVAPIVPPDEARPHPASATSSTATITGRFMLITPPGGRRSATTVYAG